MKTVLVITDFSDAAYSAVRYGMELAKAFHARVILLNVYTRMPIVSPESEMVVSEKEMLHLIQQKLRTEAEEFASRYEIDVTYLVKDEAIVQAIVKSAEAHHADLVIAGMKAHDKNIRKILGSTVTQLLKKTKIPLLVIPERRPFVAPRNIVLANEEDIPASNGKHLTLLQEIAEHFQSKVSIVRVSQNHLQEIAEVFNYPFHLSKQLDKVSVQYRTITGHGVAEALNDYVAGNKADMLVMMPGKHGFIRDMLHRSDTRAAIFITAQPLLVLPLCTT